MDAHAILALVGVQDLRLKQEAKMRSLLVVSLLVSLASAQFGVPLQQPFFLGGVPGQVGVPGFTAQAIPGQQQQVNPVPQPSSIASSSCTPMCRNACKRFADRKCEDCVNCPLCKQFPMPGCQFCQSGTTDEEIRVNCEDRCTRGKARCNACPKNCK